MNNYPLVSIVLASFNGEKYIDQQLESIVKQSYPNVEIIIVDDNSTDNTLSILEQYTNTYSNIKLFVNDINVGYIKNFEKGCSLCNGEYIALCDQDDFWHKDKIKRLVEEIGDYSMIYCDSVLCNEKLESMGSNISDRVNCQSFTNCLQQTIFCRIYGNTMLIKKSLYIKSIPFLSIIPHDWWLAFMATLHGGIKYLNEPLVFYRQHSNNIFGVVGSKRKRSPKKINEKRLAKEIIRKRANIFYETCPREKVFEKKVLAQLVKSYQSFSLWNNIYRTLLFFKYHKLLLAVKKHSFLHRFLFCCKMFFKIK